MNLLKENMNWFKINVKTYETDKLRLILLKGYKTGILYYKKYSSKS